MATKNRGLHLRGGVGAEGSSSDSFPDSLPDSLSESPSVDEEGIKTDIVPSDWVGPISAYLEIWEIKEGLPALSHEFILPPPCHLRNPTIYITDLIPETHRSLFQPFDASRTMELDLDE
ncbi:hypothetical protein BDV28DRAFT_145740 [Aspergillus coremiiformis]|uniref:Uncharacterized protein n=1 Tax=Aspergillus coremiiformis TaxID=138285 RepID=A0A5N6ZE51_9EURO|nr:hypothetical protein BDV28DRAFT_145740 [Aspergillus coremiiformis]